METKRDFAPVEAVLRAVKPDLTPVQLYAYRCWLDPDRYHETARETVARDEKAELATLRAAIHSAAYWRVRQEAAQSGVDDNILVAFTREERRGVLRAAEAAGLDMREYVRRAALVAAGVPFTTEPGPQPAVPVPAPHELDSFFDQVEKSKAVQWRPGYVEARAARDYGVAVAGVWLSLTGKRPGTGNPSRLLVGGDRPPWGQFAEAAFAYADLENWVDYARRGAREIKRALSAGEISPEPKKNNLTRIQKTT